MKKLIQFEEKVWKLIGEATEKKEPEKLRQLTSVLDHVKALKIKARKIENAVEKLEDKIKNMGLSLPVSTSAAKSVAWEVSAVDITDDALSVHEAIRAGLVPTDGSGFLVQTSLGQVFRTGLDLEQKRLREQEKIRQFFHGEGIRVGTKIVWTQIGSNKYSLEKAA